MQTDNWKYTIKTFRQNSLYLLVVHGLARARLIAEFSAIIFLLAFAFHFVFFVKRVIWRSHVQKVVAKREAKYDGQKMTRVVHHGDVHQKITDFQIQHVE